MDVNSILNHSITHDDNYFSSGVYFIWIINISKLRHRRLVYIGSGKNMKKRTKSAGHPLRKLNERLGVNFIAGCTYYACEDFLNIEKECINHFKPFLNKQHKYNGRK